MNTKTKEAIRVVGHLLETNSTSGAYAKTARGQTVAMDNTKACKFCLAGAAYLVDSNIYQPKCYKTFPPELYSEIATYLGVESLVELWDNNTLDGRKAVVQKLKNA